MGTATQVTDFSDLYTDLQNRVRVTTGVTATENQAKRYINTALFDMHMGNREKFPWCERRTTLTTQAKYNTGTVTITKGSTTLTGSSTLWNTNNDFSVDNARVGGKIVVNGTVEVYEVSAVGSDTDITLVQNYVGSDVSGGSYIYFEDEYALSDDFLRPLDFSYFDRNRQIKLIQHRVFKERFVRNKTTGKILFAAIVDEAFNGSTTPVRKVVFHNPPDDAELVPYSFITNKLAVTSAGVESTQLVNDDDEPIVPLHARHLIVYHALYNWYRDKKDDTRSVEAKGDYDQGILRLTADLEIGANKPQMRPRSYFRRSRRRGRGRHTLGTAFDELRDRW